MQADHPRLRFHNRFSLPRYAARMILGRTSAGLCLAIAALSMLLAACDGKPQSKVDPSEDSDANYSYEEITVDISIGDERGTFTNLTQCHRVPVPNSDGATARYYQTGGAVVGSFPSGRGFVLDLGRVCAQFRLLKSIHPYVAENDWPGGYYPPNDPKTHPFDRLDLGASRWALYVFDDVTNPKAGRFYVGPDYFWQGDRSLNVHSITTRSPTSSAEKAAWHKRWNESGNRFGWLNDFHERHKDDPVDFNGVFAQIRPFPGDHSGKDVEGERLAPYLADPGNAGRLWILMTGGSDWTFPGVTLFGVRQGPDGLDVMRAGADAMWTTPIYAGTRHDPRPPGQIDSSCWSFRNGVDLQAGARFQVDGADTGLRMFYRDEGPAESQRRQKTVMMQAYNTQRGEQATFTNMVTPCLNPARIVTENRG